MGVDGKRQRTGPERLPEEHRLGCRRKVFLSPNHVTDPHLAVVHDTGENEQRVTVRLRHDKVVDRRVREADLSADHIGHDRDTLSGNPETQSAPRRPLESPVPTKTVITRYRVGLGPLQDYLPRAVAGIQIPVRPELLESCLVVLPALGLTVRTLVPVDPEPPERGTNAAHPLFFVALGVGVFDPEDEHAPVAACEAPVVERGAGTPDVEVTGGGRRDPDANGPLSDRVSDHLAGHSSEVTAARVLGDPSLRRDSVKNVATDRLVAGEGSELPSHGPTRAGGLV